MSRFDVDDDSDDDTSGGLSSQLPTEAPFLAFINDTEAAELDVLDFFGSELEVLSVTVAKNEAKVEFKDRDTLARALFYSGRLLNGREAKISLFAGGAPPPPPPPPPPPAPVAKSTSSSSAGNGSGGSGGRGAGAGAGRGGRGGRWSSGRESRDAEGGREGGRGGRSATRSSIFGRDSAPRRSPPPPAGEGGEGEEKGGEAVEGAEKKERPRLQLKPRSKPLVEGGGESGAAKPSIFGGGKAHDEVAFEKKWQEKHKDDPKPVLPAGEEEGGEGERGPSGSRYSMRGDRTLKPTGGEEGAAGVGAAAGSTSRVRSGSWGSSRKEGVEGGRGGGGAGGRGGAGAVPGRGPNPNKKPVVKKAPVGADEWQEVEHVAVKKRVEGGAHGRGGEGGEGDDKVTRVVGGAFAALNMDEDSD